MNRGLWTSIICVAILLSTAVSAFAQSDRYRERRERAYRSGFEGQTFLRLHAGISTPTGDFDDAVDAGLGLGASIGYGIGSSTMLSWGVAYHRFGENFVDSNGDLVDGDISIVPITMAVDYGFSTRSSVRPWISGGLGLYHVSEDVTVFDSPPFQFSDSESSLGFNFGFGIAMPTSGRSAFGVGFKYHHINGDAFPDANFLTLQAGLSFPL